MIRKDIKARIRAFFFKNPSAKLRVRQIEKTLHLPLPSVIRYCRELEKENILVRVRMGEVVFYTADRSSEKFLLAKKLFNISQIYDCGLVDYLKTELHNPTMIVFGSYARGEDIENSDIDLYVEAEKKELSLGRFERKLARPLQAHYHRSIHKISNRFLANNIINGIVLNGFIEVLR